MKLAPTSLALSALLAALGGAGCTKNQLIDIAMGSGPREAAPRGLRVGSRIVLSGDMHCHVLPPDSPAHASRELPETLALARNEALDFVVLTPHVPSRFFASDDKRAWLRETQQQIRTRLAALEPTMIVIPGFEYTDHKYGHVGAAFAEPEEVLGALSTVEARESPARFFEMWVAHGGLLTINHPVNRSIPTAPFRELVYDLSWRGFQPKPVPDEIAWITAHAQSVETYNSTVTELRDMYVLGEEDRSLREASHLVDRVARSQQRRIAAVGGSDSHGSWLRATTFVLAEERSVSGIREALTTGRTCVRGPEACTLEVRLAGSQNAWLQVGDAITAEAPADRPASPLIFEARASGDATTFVVNGAIVGTGLRDQVVPIAVPANRCSLVRAIVDRSWSSAIYVNCF